MVAHLHRLRHIADGDLRIDRASPDREEREMLLRRDVVLPCLFFREVEEASQGAPKIGLSLVVAIGIHFRPQLTCSQWRQRRRFVSL